MNNPVHFGPNQSSNKQAEDELLHDAKLNLLSAASELIMQENKATAHRLGAIVNEIETIRCELLNHHRDSEPSSTTTKRMRKTSSCPGI